MSLVEELLEQEDGQIPEADKAEAPAEEKAAEPKTENVISEELASEYHLPDWMIGKPISELAKSYREAQKFISQGKHKQPKVEEKVDGKVEEKVQDVMEDLPDPIDEPEKFRTALKKALSEAESKAEQRVLKLIEERYQPYFKRVEEEATTAQQRQIASDIQEALGIDAGGMQEVLKAFVESNPKRVKALQKTYAEDPELLVEDVKNFYYSQQYEETRKEISKKATEQTISKIKGAQTQKPTAPQRISVGAKPVGLVDELLADEMELAKMQGM